ncbi:leucyl aminopeptidase [Phycicoccus sp. Root563]|uniref:leucyl aminopeptidase family protein n=1 Tax=Phycicoccus sp. Root563 TaxID=1736562 RepID=UPI0007037EF6|nr:leucyl aminopeptidase family protein [Phycicoccus sp. Root563]KQZ89129.1 leucyl aminopeptidase [Phycicoccus sp. Root563]
MPAPELLDPPSSSWSVRPDALADVLADLDPTDLLLAVPVHRGGLRADSDAAGWLPVVGLDATDVQAAHEPSGEPGAVTRLPLVPGERAARTVLLVGLGDAGPADLRSAGAALGRAGRGRAHLVVAVTGLDAQAQAALVEGIALGGYTSPRWRGPDATPSSAPVAGVTLVGTFDEVACRRAVTRARATMVARNLAVVPSNTKNPAWMAAQARTIGRRAGLDVKVWTERDLRSEGFGGLLAVGGGSATPPRLVQLSHEPAGATSSTPHVVLVGKGITFDTGGLDIKPAEGMLAMKTDMSGSAIVLAVVAACAALDLPVRVTGLLALAENAVSGSAYRPSDVITMYGGRTVEIGNTDAEGRIVMADALAYADAHLAPDVLLDIATLTGAARVALGRSMAPVYATDDALSDALVAAGRASGELLWPFPLVEDYRFALDSVVADVNHIAGTPVGAGSITAALFLREFVGERRWAHLDIAGVGRSDVDRGLLTKGGTGFGARLLLTWLEEMA